MSRKKYLIFQLFYMLFTISISVAVLPCGVINVHGLFGEITTYTIVEDKEQEVADNKFLEEEKVQTVKGKNIFNLWFEILLIVICISFCSNLVKLPRGDTIVTLKVRMDN